MSKTLVWDATQTPEELKSMLTVLGETFGIVEGQAEDAVALEFVKAEGNKLEVALSGNKATITYGKLPLAARGVTAVLSDIVQEGKTYTEETPFEKFGIMLDCSRNAVMTVEHVKSWMDQISLMGYNLVMLYTEETYELPGEPFFGYLRGRYTAEELKEIDRYAASLNIEVIGCIQTLGHLEHLLKWGHYGHIKDTARVMMVDEPATYELIDKMIAQYAACCKSRRIHIGMDETHDLGRGAFMDRHGYERGYDIFNRHLAKVVDICKKYGLKPMIWSDMYFRMGTPTMDYYDVNTVIPDDVKDAIPAEAELVYWDYYHDNEEFYLDWIDRHRKLDKEPLMASGVWTWAKVWYDHKITSDNAVPCIHASRKAGLKEVFFTMWGDNGAYCEFESAMAGLAFCAEHAYAGDAFNEENLAAVFETLCGVEYQAVIDASDLNRITTVDAYLWDDPMLNVHWKGCEKGDPGSWNKALERCGELAEKIGPAAEITEPIDMNHAWNLLQYFTKRISFSLALDSAYAARDAKALEDVANQIPDVIESINMLLASLRRQWMRKNKPNGLEVLQSRFGGLKQRYMELQERLCELIDGEVDTIPELDELPG